MTQGREAVEGYGHIDLALSNHTLALLRKDLSRESH